MDLGVRDAAGEGAGARRSEDLIAPAPDRQHRGPVGAQVLAQRRVGGVVAEQRELNLVEPSWSSNPAVSSVRASKVWSNSSVGGASGRPEAEVVRGDHVVPRPNNARWCSMAVCGNRMKARRHYQRTRTAG
ncbi:CGNR zinc finger domain-containing protein [Actinoallomurus iriomotensis]|uniref:CGNR zinc finger domain-containing protein n=1 Tax=Actinoallomurus iriomotensis TaxID=478107 RepID=UPI0025571614|nr:CGNR zinc finger domain-containing protein [Actinoallomurus iriomotensis]